MTSSSSRPTKVKDLDLEYFLFIPHLLRFLDLILHQEVPKLFSQQELRGVVVKRTAKQSKLRQFETDPRQENFLLKFLDVMIHHEVPILKLFSQQDLMDKTTAPTTHGSAVRVHRVPGSAGSRDIW
jgi:hypothetical protein